MQRYELGVMESGSSGESYPRIMESPTGDMVKWEDHCQCVDAQHTEIMDMKKLFVHLELKYRQQLWLSHGHKGLYGDDGEMQCQECQPYGVTDYKRDALAMVEDAYRCACVQRASQRLQEEHMKQSHITHALMIEATTKIEEQRSVIARLKEERREIVNVQQNTINMLQQRLKKIMERHFPIMKGPSVPWVVMIPHETMCQVNHHQSLQRIAERGGLSPGEAWCVVSGIDLSRRKTAIPWDEYEAEWEKFAERVNREYVLGDANVNTAADDPGSVQKDSNI